MDGWMGWMDGWDGWMDGIFYNTELYQIKTYKLKFGFHKIRTIPNYTYPKLIITK